ncbi:hypothetical protein WA538_005095, partial [Blastocystis sp. DL]
MEVYIPSSVIPLVIGKSGIAIEHMRKLSYAKISIHDEMVNFNDKRLISFEGDCLSIPQAFNLFMQRILVLYPRIGWVYEDSHRMANLTDSLQDPSALIRSDSYSKALVMALNPKLLSEEEIEDPTAVLRSIAGGNTMLSFLLPNKRVGSIIGSSGNTINQIRTTTGTQISVRKHVRGIEERRVDVTGTLENVYSACGLILNQLHENSEE